MKSAGRTGLGVTIPLPLVMLLSVDEVMVYFWRPFRRAIVEW